MIDPIETMSDEDLTHKIDELAHAERVATVELIAHLAEFHRRELAEKKGYSGLYQYCTMRLNFTEDEAMRRITAAKLAHKFPIIKEMLASGALRVTTLVILRKLLNFDNHREILQKAAGLSRLEVERLAASILPRADIRDHIQNLPTSKPSRPSSTPQPPPHCEPSGQTPPVPPGPSTSQPQPQPSFTIQPRPALKPADRIDPLSPGRIHFGFTGSEELLQDLERAKQLLWHKFPQGRLEDIVGQALKDLLAKRDPDLKPEPRKPKSAKQPAQTASKTAASRYIPTWVRADVWKRDGGRCAFVSSDGVRCCEQSALEYDHVVPFARGGASDDPRNIRLLCRAHNQMEAREDFPAFRAQTAARPGGVSAP